VLIAVAIGAAIGVTAAVIVHSHHRQ
jgi:uncharacterized membrane protein YgaE (UPF0421/DUF939 family)